MVDYGDEECDHINHVGLARCPGLTAAEKATAEHIRSVGLQFSAGREAFHGRTIAEQTREVFDNAKRYGNPEPEYMGPRSARRSLASMKAELI